MPGNIAHFLVAIAEGNSWACTLHQPLLAEGLLATHQAAKDTPSDRKQKLAAAAAAALNLITQGGFSVMGSGKDQKQLWQQKVYVNVCAEPVHVALTGPRGSADEAQKVRFAIRPGHAMVACPVRVTDKNRPVFPRALTSVPPKVGLSGIVYLGGLCDYRPVDMDATPPPAPDAPDRASCGGRAEVNALNAAFVDLEDNDFDHFKTILNLREDEQETVHAMGPAKKRRLKAIFTLLANSTPSLQELARSAIGAVGDAESPQEPAPPQAASARSFEASEKCVCSIYDGAKMVMFGETEEKGKKLIEFEEGKGRKKPLG